MGLLEFQAVVPKVFEHGQGRVEQLPEGFVSFEADEFFMPLCNPMTEDMNGSPQMVLNKTKLRW
jgi:hypothetical protein